MARFYQTSQPEFVQDIIYQPPWQLMQQVMATKQQGFDNAVASTELFKNMLDIKHLNFEDDRAKEIKDYWNTQIEDITSKLRANPNDYNKYMSSIRDLGRQLELDRREGNIAKLEGRYNAWQQWQKDNADLLNGNSKEGIQADPANYNRLANYWFNDIRNRATSDINAQFAGAKGIAKPDMNSKEIREALKEFKANAFEKSNGMYKIGQEYVTESEAEKAFMNLYMSNPNAKSYLQQQIMIQDPEYYDVMTGQTRELITKDSDGNTIINPLHGFASGINAWGDILSFNKQKLDEDKYGLARQDYQQKSALQAQQNSYDWQKTQFNAQQAYARDRANWGDKVAYMKQEYELKKGQEKDNALAKLEIEAAKGDADAANALKALTLQTTLTDVKNPTIDYTGNLEMLRNGNRAAGDREAKARDFARKELGGDKDSKAFYQHYDALKRQGKSDDEIIESFMKARGNGGFTSDPLDQRIQSSGIYTQSQTAEGKRKDQLETLLNNYESKKKEWFDNKFSQGKIQKAFEPLNQKGQNELYNLYVNNPSAWDVRNPDGSKSEGVVTKITRVTDAQGRGLVGYQGEDDKGNKVLIFPNSLSSPTTSVAESITLENLVNKDSQLRTSLTDSEVRRINYQMNSTGFNRDNSKSILYKSSVGDIPIKGKDGRLFIISPIDGRPIKNAPEGFSSVPELVEYIRQGK